MPDSLRAFLALTRPLFLVGGFLGFALGALAARYAGATLTAGAYVHGQVMVTAFHLMTHYANDFFDREGDRTAIRTEWSGGSGILVEGRLAPRVALWAAYGCAAIGLLCALGFAVMGAWAPAAVGTAIALFAWGYSAPPLRFAARGLGEPDTALVVAVLVPLAGYACFTGGIDAAGIAATFPGAVAMLAMMLCVEYPDLESDAASGKRNWVVRLGRRGAGPLLGVLACAPVLAACGAVGLGAPRSLAIFAALTLPIGAMLARRLRAGAYGSPAADADIAAAGVSLFVAVSAGGVLAYAALL